MDISVTSSLKGLIMCCKPYTCLHATTHYIYTYMQFSTAGPYRFIFFK